MNPTQAAPKRDFLGRSGPPGYVAGIGRGATGFTTRSDIGPAREAAAAAAAAAMASAAAAAAVADSGPPRKQVKRNENNDEEEEDEYLNESNYDEFAGYGGSLVNRDPYEEDDEEADKIYEAIDKHVDERGKALREAKIRQELERYRQERPKIQQQFSDLKASLRQVSEQEWMSIPDVGDARNRKQRVARQDKFTPVPDSLLAHQMKVASGGERVVYIDPVDPDEMDVDDDVEGEGIKEEPNTVQPAKNATNEGGLNIGEMSDLRSSYMSVQLSRASNSIDSQTRVDPKDYLTKYQNLTPNQITDASQLKEFRKQYASLRASNPNLANVWLASVRLEEAAGKLSTARGLILEGCKKCPKSVDLWLEAIRINPPDIAQSLMVKAIKENPRSVKLWIKAADLESDLHLKRKVYEKARDMVPKSALLWKKSIELEEPDEARKILREAVECCPEEVELFLALAQLEPYEQAQRVLIKASDRHPTERGIWIMSAKLEEAAGHEDFVKSIIKTSIEQIIEKGLEIKREEWLEEATAADKSNYKTTCHEIIKRVIGLGCTIDGQDQKQQTRKLEIWRGDIEKFIANGSIECARAVYECIVDDKHFRQMESNWMEYAKFERKYGTSETFESVLKRATSSEDCCSKIESLWLMLANERRHHLHETRRILSDALDANPDSEMIILEAVELECENGNYKEARRILADACMSAKTPQLIRRAAKLEWTLGNIDEAIRMLKIGVEEYKDFAEFYLMLGQIEEQRNDNDRAKIHYSNGLKFNPTSVALWISIANIEEKTGFLARARSKLEMARLRNPKCPLLWLESARFEIRAHLSKKGGRGGRPDIVSTILAKGIKECKDCPDVDTLKAEQEAFNKRKFV